MTTNLGERLKQPCNPVPASEKKGYRAPVELQGQWLWKELKWDT